MENEIVISYICDRKACIHCNDDKCAHTNDIRHAANFKSHHKVNDLAVLYVV